MAIRPNLTHYRTYLITTNLVSKCIGLPDKLAKLSSGRDNEGGVFRFSIDALFLLYRSDYSLVYSLGGKAQEFLWDVLPWSLT